MNTIINATAAPRYCLVCQKAENSPLGNVCKDGYGCRYPVNSAAVPNTATLYPWPKR